MVTIIEGVLDFCDRLETIVGTIAQAAKAFDPDPAQLDLHADYIKRIIVDNHYSFCFEELGLRAWIYLVIDFVSLGLYFLVACVSITILGDRRATVRAKWRFTEMIIRIVWHGITANNFDGGYNCLNSQYIFLLLSSFNFPLLFDFLANKFYDLIRCNTVILLVIIEFKCILIVFVNWLILLVFIILLK